MSAMQDFLSVIDAPTTTAAIGLLVAFFTALRAFFDVRIRAAAERELLEKMKAAFDVNDSIQIRQFFESGRDMSEAEQERFRRIIDLAISKLAEERAGLIRNAVNQSSPTGRTVYLNKLLRKSTKGKSSSATAH